MILGITTNDIIRFFGGFFCIFFAFVIGYIVGSTPLNKDGTPKDSHPYM